jgi:hypothetical protein
MTGFTLYKELAGTHLNVDDHPVIVGDGPGFFDLSKFKYIWLGFLSDLVLLHNAGQLRG